MKLLFSAFESMLSVKYVLMNWGNYAVICINFDVVNVCLSNSSFFILSVPLRRCCGTVILCFVFTDAKTLCGSWPLTWFRGSYIFGVGSQSNAQPPNPNPKPGGTGTTRYLALAI
jgi:hypothetical protein